MAPELVRVGQEAKAAPALRTLGFERLRGGCGLELLAGADRLPLVGCGRASSRPWRTRAPVRVRFLRRNPLDLPFDANLNPVTPEQQRRPRVRRELLPLARRVAGEEREATFVGALQEQRARRRPSVGGRGRDHHLVALHPFVEELEWIARHTCASSGTSCIVRMGDGSRKNMPVSAPTVAIQSVGRRPIIEPSTPPSAVPTGRTPLFTTMNAPETRERRWGGITAADIA